MTLKIVNVTVEEDGRDRGKVFQLTEADAMRVDKWGIRAMLAMTKRGLEIPDDVVKMGIMGFLAIGAHRLRGVDWEDIEPLLDEMMTCVRIVPTPSVPNVVRNLMVGDIEEYTTCSMLRHELFKLHLGFSSPAGP